MIKKIFVPYYFKKTDDYQLVEFMDWQNLEKGPYGILQPRGLDTIDPQKIDLAIVPGVVFSTDGVRLGYGKGVYDRLLKESGAIEIGLAYEFQIVNKLPKEKHDLLMDFVITEKKIRRIKS